MMIGTKKTVVASTQKILQSSASCFIGFSSRLSARGWAYWGDARAEMMQLVGDLGGLQDT